MKTDRKPLAVVITDTHLDDTNADVVYRVFHQATEYAKQRGLPLLHGGDWYTSRKGQRLSTMLAQQRNLSLGRKRDVEVHGIIGNHDKADQSIPQSWMDVHSYYPNVFLYPGGPKSIEVSYLELGDLMVGMLSFFPDEIYLERLALLTQVVRQFNKPMVLLTHIGINGVRNNDGSEHQGGIRQSDFSDWNLVLVGHYHNASELAGGRIKYIGSAYQANYGEDSHKGFSVLFSDLSLQHVQADFPHYVSVTTDAHQLTEESVEGVRNVYSSDYRVRLVVKGTAEELAVCSATLRKAESMGMAIKTMITAPAGHDEEMNAAATVVFEKSEILTNWVRYTQVENLEEQLLTEGQNLLQSV